MAAINKIVENFLKKAIRGYQLAISPFIGTHCRFFPSCSQYCEQAIAQWGIIRGLCLTCRRLCRCHPFCSGGYDPVPSRDK
ncbi:MAG: membrane protein insertion efficiency factor YidD [Gammaproteobacteria bacterium]